LNMNKQVIIYSKIPLDFTTTDSQINCTVLSEQKSDFFDTK